MAVGGWWWLGRRDQRGQFFATARSTFLAIRCTCGVRYTEIAAKGFAAYPGLDNGRKFLGATQARIVQRCDFRRRWIQIKIPLARFSSASVETLEPHHLKSNRV